MDIRGKILVADDDPAFRDLLGTILSDAGHEVIVVGAKADAYDRAVVERPDIILSDINAPTMHGFQFIDWLQASPATRGIPVLFVTGFSDEGTIRTALGRGAVGYITKPFDVARLLPTMIRVMQEYPVVRWEPRAPFPDDTGDAGLVQFREWSFIRECVRSLAASSPVRTIVLEDPQEWTMDLVIEAGPSLLALRTIRTYDRDPVPHYHVHAFKRAMQRAGLERGVLHTFLTPAPFARLSARLLGIELMGLPETARLLRAGMLAPHAPGSRHPFVELARASEATMTDVRFAPFVRRLRDELETLNNSTLEVSEEQAPGRMVFLSVSDDGALTFTSADPTTSFRVSQSDFYDLLARLWMQRRLTKVELGEQPFDRSCLLALFSRLPSLRCQEQEIHLP